MASEIIINTWYDTVTHASALVSDYESTGNEFKSYSFRPDEIDEAVLEFSLLLARHSYELTGPIVNATLYSEDPDEDFFTGTKYYYRLEISVLSKFRNKDLIDQLEQKLQEAIKTIL